MKITRAARNDTRRQRRPQCWHFLSNAVADNAIKLVGDPLNCPTNDEERVRYIHIRLAYPILGTRVE